MNATAKPAYKNPKNRRDAAREKIWQEMDDLEQRLYDLSDNQAQKRTDPRKTTYRKPDKEKKLSQIQAYEQALQRHRSSCSQFHNPFKEKDIPLNLDIQDTIKFIQRAMDDEKDVSLALRSVGLKRVKILFKCGAVEHFQSVLGYLSTRDIPQWMKMKHQELLKRQF